MDRRTLDIQAGNMMKMFKYTYGHSYTFGSISFDCILKLNWIELNCKTSTAMPYTPATSLFPPLNLDYFTSLPCTHKQHSGCLKRYASCCICLQARLEKLLNEFDECGGFPTHGAIAYYCSECRGEKSRYVGWYNWRCSTIYLQHVHPLSARRLMRDLLWVWRKSPWISQFSTSPSHLMDVIPVLISVTVHFSPITIIPGHRAFPMILSLFIRGDI